MKSKQQDVWAGLPGAELVVQGIDDLEAGKLTETALLVLIAEPRLSRLGISLKTRPTISGSYEHALYGLLETKMGAGAHAHFNSLIRRIVSFEHALEREHGKMTVKWPQRTQETQRDAG